MAGCPSSAPCTTAATTRSRWTGRWRRPDTRTSGPSGTSDARTGAQLGIGLSCYVEITGAGAESGNPSENATVEVHPDGSATILAGTSPHGQGHATVWAMLASDELGIPIDKTTLKWGDTDPIPQGGTGGSPAVGGRDGALGDAPRSPERRRL
jgi:CO/xanthine dehydrogenase Mo-binding subunit